MKIELDYLCKREDSRIVNNLNTLNEARSIGIHLLVGGVLATAIGIAHLCRHNATYLLEIVLRTPEATTRQVYLLHILILNAVKHLLQSV